MLNTVIKLPSTTVADFLVIPSQIKQKLLLFVIVIDTEFSRTFYKYSLFNIK
jgi:hypothetical protein